MDDKISKTWKGNFNILASYYNGDVHFIYHLLIYLFKGAQWTLQVSLPQNWSNAKSNNFKTLPWTCYDLHLHIDHVMKWLVYIPAICRQLSVASANFNFLFHLTVFLLPCDSLYLYLRRTMSLTPSYPFWIHARGDVLFHSTKHICNKLVLVHHFDGDHNSKVQ